MSTPLWQVIFKKEFFEVLRDPRTRFTIFVSPLLITSLMLMLIGSMQQSRLDASKETFPVAFVGVRESATLRDVMGTPDHLKVDDLKTKDEAEAEVKSGRVRAALIFPPDTQASIDQSKRVTVTVLFDEGKSASQDAADRLRSLVTDRGSKLAALKLLENSLPQEIATPFQAVDENVHGGSSPGTLFAATLLPYILSLYAIVGGVSVANDSVAGEKERGTLETLLVSPASRREIVTGKFLSVVGISMVGGLLSIVGFVLPFYTHLPVFEWIRKDGLTLSPSAILAMGLVQVPLAILGAGLLLTVSTFSRNQREAQTYLSPVILSVSVGSIMSMVLKTNAPIYWAAVPITNAAMVLKMALEGEIHLPFVVIACATSLLYAAAAVLFAAHAFQKESILLKA